MDCGLSETQSCDDNDSAGSGGDSRFAPRFAYSERFQEAFPYYLAMGMTYEQYWEGSPWLVKAYRKAARLRSEMDDERAWIQGAYFYESLLRASPAFRAFSKSDPKPYIEQPYTQKKKAVKKVKKKDQDNKARDWFEAWAISFNKKFEEEAEK